jgi:uncharacterized protein
LSSLNSRSVLVIAKCPKSRPVKTRIAKTLGQEAATCLAEAMLLDTLELVNALEARKVLVIDGDYPKLWARSGFEVIPQRGEGFAERLANAFVDAGPGFLIGSDTPQISKSTLEFVLEFLPQNSTIPIGPSVDGGYWGIGMNQIYDLFDNVPMSSSSTYDETLKVMARLDLKPYELPALNDIDEITDLLDLRSQLPEGSHTYNFLKNLDLDLNCGNEMYRYAPITVPLQTNWSAHYWSAE